jgi:hypothetical protein
MVNCLKNPPVTSSHQQQLDTKHRVWPPRAPYSARCQPGHRTSVGPFQESWDLSGSEEKRCWGSFQVSLKPNNRVSSSTDIWNNYISQLLGESRKSDWNTFCENYNQKDTDPSTPNFLYLCPCCVNPRGPLDPVCGKSPGEQCWKPNIDTDKFHQIPHKPCFSELFIP